MKSHVPLILLTTLAITGCGGGGSGGSGSITNPPPNPPPPDEKISGIWSGTLVGQQSGVTNNVDCLVTEAGELACLLSDPSSGELAAGVQGMVAVSNTNQVSGSGTVHAASGFTLSDGSTFSNFTVNSGTVDERNTLNLTATGAEPTAINLTFDTLYDRNATLSRVAGIYSNFTVNGEPTSFSVSASGEIFAQSSSGCVGNGQISVGDPEVNHYDMQVTVSNCPGLNGTYSGLAISSDFVATDDLLVFAIFSGQLAIFGSVTE